MALIVNRKARADYEIEDTLVAGLVLTGPEVKSVRLGHGSLTGSFVKIIDNEAFLIGAQISPYAYADNSEYDVTRTGKLLLKRSQLDKLIGLINQQKRTLVPLALKVMGRTIKLEIAVGRGKKKHEKRETLKKRKQKRDLAKDFKAKLKGF